jgi:hypothetical protein
MIAPLRKKNAEDMRKTRFSKKTNRILPWMLDTPASDDIPKLSVSDF